MKLLQIDGRGRVVGEWESAAEAARELNLDASHIGKVLRGKRSRHGGYSWKYEEGGLDRTTNNESLDSKSFDYKNDTAVLSGKTQKPITSLEEAIEFFEVDTIKWDVERFIVNAWDVTMKINDVPVKRTNYQVKVFLKAKLITLNEALIDIDKVLVNYTPKSILKIKGDGTLVANFADFHIGAEIKDLVRTKDFDIKIIADYMFSSAEIINSYGAKRVVVNMCGDFFESVSGLNHDDSWKGLGKGMYGANVIIYANELIGGALLSNIHNLEEVNLVAGNHDRITPKKTVDNYGEGAKLLAHLLSKDFPDLTINYDHLILVREIDGINYLLTHGHHGISKKDVSKIVMDYGDTSLFNLWIEGHIHTRKTTKVFKTKLAEYNTIDVIQLDDLKYRKLVLGPLFTGNFFSESIGFSGHAGFTLTQNNGNGIPIVHDYSL